MSRWYRAYEGTVTDAKLGEVALVAECSRSVVIAAWHCILESCAAANRSGNFDATLRRVAVILCEPIPVMERVFSEFENLGLIQGNYVPSWSRRQYESDNSTARSKKHRENKKAGRCNADATLHDRCATAPETETETETDNNSLRSLSPEHEKKNGFGKKAIDKDATLSDENLEIAISRGLRSDQAAAEWQKFKAWNLSEGKKSADWDAAWSLWLGRKPLSVADIRPYGGGKPPIMNVVPAINREASAEATGKVWIKADTPEWSRAVQRLGRKPPIQNGGWYFDKEISELAAKMGVANAR